jgi:hypothetical protein
MPRFFAAGEVSDALVTVYGLNDGQGRWRPTPSICAADAGGKNKRQWWRACREVIGQRLDIDENTSPLGIKPHRCESAELLFYCCGSVAALPASANCNWHVAKK